MRWTLVLLTLLLVLSVRAWAEEQRCTELGAACVCSEPLNTTTFTTVSPAGDGSFYNPGDSTTKECLIEGTAAIRRFGGNAFAGDVTGTNDATILARLPRRTVGVQHVARIPEGGVGSFDIGHYQNIATSRTAIDALIPPGGGTVGGQRISRARIAVRYYVYYSDNFTFTQAFGSCTNGKRSEIDTMTITHGFEDTYDGNPGSGATIAAYNFYWNIGDCAARGLISECGAFRLGINGPSAMGDCCSHGPSTSANETAPGNAAAYRGKWWLFEFAISNRFGPGWRLQGWARNVTDDLPEQVILDSNGSYGAGGNPFVPSSILVPNEINTEAVFKTEALMYGYRAGVCTGYNAASHVLVAQWDTNLGQRIGTAYEVEGGTVSQQPPETPTNLQVN